MCGEKKLFNALSSFTIIMSFGFSAYLSSLISIQIAEVKKEQFMKIIQLYEDSSDQKNIWQQYIKKYAEHKILK